MTFRGWVPHERSLELISESAVVVLPSEAEGMPMVLLEAMARAVPVVSTAVGGIPELLGDGAYGILVPVGDAGALAQSVTELLTDRSHRERVGKAGRKRITDTCATPIVAAQLAALFRDVLEAGPPDPRVDLP